jgi:lipid II:glycine glycyltransferase (peptidoglycan interpeptide bridge formation enzyme)
LSTAATPSLEFRAVVDLTRSDDELFGDMRKGHRQQIRWGQANMQVQVVDRTRGDRGSFDGYRELHAAAAGRITRGAESWDAMFDAIVSGSGDLVLGSINGQLVSGTLILDAGDTAYYSSGAYDRSRFDKPLAHWPLFNAILRAKKRGLRWFDVGEIGCSGSAKEQSIAYFKSGFSSTREMSVIWTLPVSNPQPTHRRQHVNRLPANGTRTELALFQHRPRPSGLSFARFARTISRTPILSGSAIAK